MARKFPPSLLAFAALLAVVGNTVIEGIFGNAISEAINQFVVAVLGKDAEGMTAMISPWVLPGLISLVMVYGAYLVGVHERRARPSSLQVEFEQRFSGHAARTSFSNGEQAIFYRLLVRPPKGQVRIDCRATLIDVMGAGPGHLVSIWGGERLPLTWATHMSDPTISIDLRGDHGQFLDVIYVSERGGVGFGTPGFAVPNSVLANGLQSIDGCVFVVSISDSESAARKYMLRFMHTGTNWDDNEVVLLPQPRRLFGLLAPR